MNNPYEEVAKLVENWPLTQSNMKLIELYAKHGISNAVSSVLRVHVAAEIRAMQPTAQASEAIPEQALKDARKALVSADHAIKGREHTGFIHKAIAQIDSALSTMPVEPVTNQDEK